VRLARDWAKLDRKNLHPLVGRSQRQFDGRGMKKMARTRENEQFQKNIQDGAPLFQGDNGHENNRLGGKGGIQFC